MRQFETGATRDDEDNKLDYGGFLSPLVLLRYAQYMHKCRIQADGKLRASDNWKKGIPLEAYMKSKWRHFMDTWMYSQTGGTPEQREEALCAELFNTMGMLHELLKLRMEQEGDSQGGSDLDISPMHSNGWKNEKQEQVKEKVCFTCCKLRECRSSYDPNDTCWRPCV
jgi:hypothetical protein